VADTARWYIDDAAEGEIVVGIDGEPPQREDVLDFRAIIEPHRADDAIRYPRAAHAGLQCARQGVAAIEDRDVIQRETFLAEQSMDVRGDLVGFVAFVAPADGVEEIAFLVLSPQLLANAERVVGDDRVGGLEDVSNGAVVLLESNEVCALEGVLKLKEVLNVCATP